MSREITIHNVGVLIGIASAFVSGLIILIYLQKEYALKNSNRTWWQKYGQPGCLLTITSFVTATGFFWSLLYGNESIHTLQDWVIGAIGYVGCFGCSVGGFLFVYIIHRGKSFLSRL